MKTVKINELKEGQDITLFLRNGEKMRGVFQFIDGDDVVLKPLNPNSKAPCLGWKMAWISKIVLN